MSYLQDLVDPGASWCPDCGEMRGICQCDQDTKPIITLPTLPHDPTPVVTMTDGNLIVATVRIGSIVHRLMLDKGYKVVKTS